MFRLIRFFGLLLLGIFLFLQLPPVQYRIVGYILPKDMHIQEIRTYGLFPIYVHIPVLKISKNHHDFLELYDGVLNTRYFLFRKQVALNAQHVVLHKLPADDKGQASSKISPRENLEQLKHMMIFHDLNINSFQYKAGEKNLCDYKIDWDLKRDSVKLYARQNGENAYFDRLEITGVPYADGIKNGRINVAKGGFCLCGKFDMKDWVIQSDLTIEQAGQTMVALHPKVDLNATDHVDIPDMEILSALFEWTGNGHIQLDPIEAVLKDDRFFLKSKYMRKGLILI